VQDIDKGFLASQEKVEDYLAPYFPT